MKLKPEIAVIDFLTPAPHFVCDELGIKTVTNMPLPMDVLNAIGGKLMMKKNTKACCGFVCLRQIWFDWFMGKILLRKTFKAKEWYAHLNKIQARVTLFNSFWGFEDAFLLPPNIVMTGPLIKN